MGCDSKRVLAAAMLTAAFWLAGCPGAAPPGSCDSCPQRQVCVLVGASHEEARWECREVCDPATPETNVCRVGQACVPNRDPTAPVGFCDRCEHALCPEGQECMGDECRPVDCGFYVDCPRATDFCDPFVNTCYPSNGACASVDDCPHFDESLTSAGRLACREGFCRIDPRPLAQVPGLEAPAQVELLSPRHGTRFPSVDTFQLAWSGPRADAIVLILTGLPQTPGDVLSLAIWGASIPADQPTELRLEQGVEIIDGVWSPNHSASLPENTPLFALVQLVEGEQLLAISPLVPFIVGQSWKEPGDICTQSIDCEHPRYVQSCLENQCRVLCASNRDCLPWSQTCSWPDWLEGGLRYCR